VLERERLVRAVVPDTSVVVKWYVEDEADRDRARALRDAFAAGRIRLVAPPLILAELANALRYRADFSAGTVQQALESASALGMAFQTLTTELLKRAVQLSYTHDVAV